MYDGADEVIYVGKAKDLKKRLSSYFRTNVAGEKTRALVKNIRKVDVTVTHTETEALILEHNYIKLYLPKYNVLLRDDKSYPYIFLSASAHPRLTTHRGVKKRKGEYFGPYPDSGAVRESLHLLQKIFPVRQCEDSVYANRSRPCLMYQIGRCLGPCVKGLVSEEDYKEQVNFVRLFLQGKDRQVIASMVEKKWSWQVSSWPLKKRLPIAIKFKLCGGFRSNSLSAMTAMMIWMLSALPTRGEWLVSMRCIFVRARSLAVEAIFPKCPATQS